MHYWVIVSILPNVTGGSGAWIIALATLRYVRHVAA